MTARTALTAVSLAWDTGTAEGAGATPDATNGNIVASPGPFNAILLVNNGSGGSISLIVRGSGYTGLPAGAANSAIPVPAPFSQAAEGDLTVVVTASETAVVPIQNTDRFTQADGSLWLDWTASTDMTVWVLTLPYVVA